MPSSQDEVLSLATKRHILGRYVDDKSEEDFMKEVLLPLFEKMQFETVYNHGPDELGKDFVLKKKNEFGEDEIYCVVVKNGDISGASRGSANLSEVKRQVEMSLETTLDEFGLKGKLPNKVLVMTPGKISSQARRQIAQNKGALNSTRVSFFWNEQLVPLLDRYYPFFFQVSLPSTAKYLADLVDHIETITTIDSNFSGLLNLVNLKCMKESKSAFEKPGNRVFENPEDVSSSGSFVWIQGGTGSGKTFTVYRMAQRALGKLKSDTVKEKTPHKETIQIPIYIKASNLNFDPSQVSLEKFLMEQVRNYSHSCTENDLRDWLADFHVLIVIDEYEFNKPRGQLNALAKEILRFPKASILVLSRVLSEDQLKFDRSPEIWNLKELNLSSARKVLHSCIPSENKKGIQLYNDMLSNGVLERVPRTPLALNVLSQVFSGHLNSTPVNMFEFFDMFFELVLGRWEPRRDLESPLDYNQIRGFLQEVAYDMVLNKKLSVPVMMIIPVAEKILASARNSSMKPLEFIESVAKYGEVAVIRENEFSFTQRTFMEFLAGCEFEKYHWKNDFIIENITDLNWEDALLFAAGSKKKDNDLLESVAQIKESSSSELFFKVKNIAGLVLALYRSEMAMRQTALKEGVRAAVRLRDNDGFSSSIKRLLKDDREIVATLVNLSLFSTFYGKSGMHELLMDAFAGCETDREKFYVLAGLIETLENSESLAPLMPHIPNEVSSKEGLAFGPYVQGEASQSEKADAIKSLLKEKEIKKLTDKAVAILRQERKEQTKFIP